MKVEFNASTALKQYGYELMLKRKKLRKELQENARIASNAALLAIRTATPHIGDGKPRGRNVITNSLMNAWRVGIEFSSSNSVNPGRKVNNFAKISFSNRKKYADYVQYGHRMTPHFVPWLYKDGDLISRETDHCVKLFGLIMGTKTPFVKGVDMIGPGIEVFNTVFKELCEDTLYKTISRR